jgi:two-component system response regulator HydG
MGRRISGLSPACGARLTAYAWPGNVRELANVIERAVALTQSPRLEVEDLPRHVRSPDASHALSAAKGTHDLVPLQEVERRYIRRVLEAAGGNKTLAAQILGVHRRTLYRKDLQEEHDPHDEKGERRNG